MAENRDQSYWACALFNGNGVGGVDISNGARAEYVELLRHYTEPQRMDRDIRATIERLEQRIAKLQQARQILLEEYGSAGDDAPAPRIGSTGSLQEAFATLSGESADGGPDGAKTR